MTLPTETCPRCGATLLEGDALCPYCGTANPLPQVKPAPQAFRPSAAPAPLPEQDNLPPELARLQAPKPSQPLEASGCMLFFFLSWTLFSALFLVLGVGMYIRDSIAYNRLSREGIPAAATITNLEIHSGDDSDSYYVSYQFQASIKGDTARFRGSDQVSSSFFSRLKVGQTIEIIYSPADPSISAVKAELRPASMTLLLCFGGLGGLFTLIGLILISSSIMGIVNTNRLRLGGRVTQGIVFKKWTETDSAGDTTYFVAYVFKAEIPGQGVQRIPRAEQNKTVYDKYQVGDSISIRYLPVNPQTCQVKIPK